ncbi:HAD family hydrolase [Microbacterium halophytorum]|uniref:HAD family hydrolase n=1 Tax=Microbacterium halophytorum TaxID=2067568 RepID=UPI001E562512|nr:HAD family hydrolase [Microbacterium halophytorum]
MRRLIALDVDGTVILEDEQFSPGVVDAVRDAEANGHVVMLATGRSWEATSRIHERLGIRPEYVVCSNGAAVLSRGAEGYERHTTATFDPTEVLDLLQQHLPDANYMAELADGRRRYTHRVSDWLIDDANASHVDFDDLKADPVSRIVVVSPEHTEGEFTRMVESMGLSQVSYSVGWTAWLDIAPEGVDKSTGLEEVRERLGIRGEDVVVIGDGRNDVGMFRWAAAHGGRAFAMGQAPDEVSHAATDITDDVEDGGVAAALEDLGLTTR